MGKSRVSAHRYVKMVWFYSSVTTIGDLIDMIGKLSRILHEKNIVVESIDDDSYRFVIETPNIEVSITSISIVVEVTYNKLTEDLAMTVRRINKVLRDYRCELVDIEFGEISRVTVVR